MEAVEDARAARRRPRARRPPGPHPRAGTGHHRPRRLPPRQLHGRAPRAPCGPCSTGRSARSATRWPTSGCCRCTGPARPTTQRLAEPGHDGRGLPRPRRPARPLRRGVRPRPVADIDYYVAFAFWKLACILEGVYARYLGGALGDRPRAVRPLPRPGRHAARPRRAATDGAAADDRRTTSSTTRTSRSTRRCSSRCSSGWIDAGAARRPSAMSVLENELGPARRHVRRRHVHRLPRPPTRPAPARRRQHRADLARDELLAGRDTAGHDVLLLSGARARRQRGALHRRGVAAGRRPRRRHDGRPRRLPLRRRRTAGRRACR